MPTIGDLTSRYLLSSACSLAEAGAASFAGAGAASLATGAGTAIGAGATTGAGSGWAATGTDVWTTLVVFLVSTYLSVLIDISKSPSFNLNSASRDLLMVLINSVIS